MFLAHQNRLSGSWVAPDTGAARLYRERPEAAKFNTVASGEGFGDLAKYRVEGMFYLPKAEVRVYPGDCADQFRSGHMGLFRFRLGRIRIVGWFRNILTAP